jgi:hypothetical protein
MSKLQEIKQAIDQLQLPEFLRLANWIDKKRKQAGATSATRNHSAFLSSYSPEDEGLYDDPQAR